MACIFYVNYGLFLMNETLETLFCGILCCYKIWKHLCIDVEYIRTVKFYSNIKNTYYRISLLISRESMSLARTL